MFSAVYQLLVACLAGCLYGLGPSGGAISVALPYLKATTGLSSSQLSMLVGACMFGAVIGGFAAGSLADWIGRKKAIFLSALVFVVGVPAVCLSGAEPMVMTVGLALEGFGAGVAGVVVPLYLAEVVAPEIRGKCTAFFQMSIIVGILASGLIGFILSAFIGAADVAEVSHAAKMGCWKGVFAFEGLPALMVILLSLRLPESPIWLKRKEAHGSGSDSCSAVVQDSLLQRRYVLPFALALVILVCNQTTGVNAVLGYSVTIFQNAGLAGTFANGADAFFKFVMLAMTAVACVLVDRNGRRFLLQIGTLGVIGSMLMAGILMLGLRLEWFAASAVTGWLVALALSVFISAFAVGPGICVWLALTELMPTRIRAVGMSIALLCNQGVSTALQSTFLPLTDRIGFGWLFIGFAACTIVYWCAVQFFLPETKGRTLEEIETFFTKDR